ncbi:MAG: hypothetical protein ACTSSK_13145 [Candidatus Heimdallarchaeota archaeon]
MSKKRTKAGIVIIDCESASNEKKLRVAAKLVEDDYPELAKIILSRESEAAEC